MFSLRSKFRFKFPSLFLVQIFATLSIQEILFKKLFVLLIQIMFTVSYNPVTMTVMIVFEMITSFCRTPSIIEELLELYFHLVRVYWNIVHIEFEGRVGRVVAQRINKHLKSWLSYFTSITKPFFYQTALVRLKSYDLFKYLLCLIRG